MRKKSKKQIKALEVVEKTTLLKKKRKKKRAYRSVIRTKNKLVLRQDILEAGDVANITLTKWIKSGWFPPPLGTLGDTFPSKSKSGKEKKRGPAFQYWSADVLVLAETIKLAKEFGTLCTYQPHRAGKILQTVGIAKVMRVLEKNKKE